MQIQWNILIGVGLMLAPWAAPAFAAEPVVRRVTVVGVYSLSGPAVESLTKPYLGRTITRNDLQSLANELSDACQSAGAILCRADIPRQDLSLGALEITMSEGYVTGIEADRAAMPVLLHAFRSLLSQRPAQASAYHQGIAALADIPGLTVRDVRPKRVKGDEYVLVIDADYQRVSAALAVTNRGSRRANPWKSYANVDLRSAFSAGDALSISYLTRPQVADELAFVRVRYESAHLVSGLKAFVEAAGSNTAPSSTLDGRDVDGELVRGQVGIRAPLLRSSTRRLDGEVRVEASQSIEREDNQALYRDELRILRAALRGQQRLGEGAAIRGFAELSHGFDMLGAGGGSRPDGEADFTKLALELNGRAVLPATLVVSAGLSAQLAYTPLLFAEEYSFGGGRYGRGYDFGEVLGERGAATYAELARPFTYDEDFRIEPYLYADVGGTWNEGDGLSADGVMLWSSGGGFRLTAAAGWALSYEAAQPLSDAPYTLDDENIRHRLDIGFQR